MSPAFATAVHLEALYRDSALPLARRAWLFAHLSSSACCYYLDYNPAAEGGRR